MYVKYGAGAKPFNKGSYSFLIAFSRQLEQALEDRPDELEDTMGALANGLAYLIGEDSGLLPGDGGELDGSEADINPTGGLQDEVEADGAAEPLSRRELARMSRAVGRAMARHGLTDMRPLRSEAVAPKGSPVPKKAPARAVLKGASRGKKRTKR